MDTEAISLFQSVNMNDITCQPTHAWKTSILIITSYKLVVWTVVNSTLIELKIPGVDSGASNRITLLSYIKFMIDEVSKPRGIEIGCIWW